MLEHMKAHAALQHSINSFLLVFIVFKGRCKVTELVFIVVLMVLLLYPLHMQSFRSISPMSLGKTINPCAHFLHIALHSLQLKNTSETADKEKKKRASETDAICIQ